MWGNPRQSWSLGELWILRRRFRIPGTTLRASSPGRSGQQGGKRKVSLQIRLWNLNFHLQCPGGSPSIELSGFIQSARRGNERECIRNIEKHVPRVLTSLLMSSPPISTSHRHFRCRSIFKFQRRSCKLSYLFPPRHQSAPESLLAGYPGTGFLSLSIDCYWMRIPRRCDPNMKNKKVHTHQLPPAREQLGWSRVKMRRKVHQDF